DDYGDIDSGAFAQGLAQRCGGGIGIDGQQGEQAVAVHVRFIDARVGADPAVVRLGDQHATGHAHDAAAFAQHHLVVVGVFSALFGDLLGEVRWLNGLRVDYAAFGFGDDFLGDDDDIAVGEGLLVLFEG